jgi:predicted DNA-binding antitoxin AbrB/MazE fold protein
MTRTFKAIFENGILRPLQPVEGVPERVPVDVTMVTSDTPARPGILDCAGTLPDKDAAEMLKAIEDEFEQVDERDW